MRIFMHCKIECAIRQHWVCKINNLFEGIIQYFYFVESDKLMGTYLQDSTKLGLATATTDVWPNFEVIVCNESLNWQVYTNELPHE